MADTWTVAKGSTACSRCGAQFREGQAYYSSLQEQAQDFIRDDYCASCWKEARVGPLFSFWKTRRSSDPRPLRINAEVVFDFFCKMRESERQDKDEMCFVLALYLARRRTLKFDSVRSEGGRQVLVFRRPRHKETFEIADPQMNEDQINTATERLKALFQTQI